MRFGPHSRSAKFQRPTGQLIEALEQRSLLAADLMYEALGVASNVLPGGMVQLNSTIDNTGDAVASAPFDVQFYLSADPTLDLASDTLIGTYNYNSSPIPARVGAVNGVAGFPFSVTIPSGTTTGVMYIIARADSGNAYLEANEGDNTRSAPIYIGNHVPLTGLASVRAVGDGTSTVPAQVGRAGEWTLTLASVTDRDSNPLTVSFYYDSDRDGVLGLPDIFLGNGVRTANTFSFTGLVPPSVQTGDGAIIAVANDGIDNSAQQTADFTIVVATPPTAGNVLGPAAARRGRQINLTANGLTGTGAGAVFYRDSNGSNLFEPGVDELIGTGTPGAPGSSSLAVTINPAWGTGTQRFFARPIDSLGQSGAAVTATVGLVANGRPAISGGFITSGATASKGSTLTLTSRNVTDDDGPERVEFYLESSGNRVFNPTLDTLLGVGTRSGNDWTLTLTVPPGFRLGANRFYSSAVDIVGVRSVTKAAQVNVTANTRPKIATFDINKSTVASGGSVTFTATGVTDNGTISRVDFYFDANHNGRFNPSLDQLLTTGRKLGATTNWRKQFTLPGNLPAGTTRVFAVAYDNLGFRSFVKSDTVIITA